MSRYIDADALMDSLGIDDRDIYFKWLIEDAPTVDVVEVVRCKDCKYFNPHVMVCEGIGNWFGLEGEWGANDYCSKAERKDDE